MDLPVGALRTIRMVAERRSFTAAAQALGYTQSAVSRQIAAAERELGAKLFDRVQGGVRLTRAGSTVLRHVVVALDALDQAERELNLPAAGARRVRVGAFAAAGVALLPRSLAILRRTSPDIEATTREGTTPSLVRALRAGTLDFAVLTARPPYRSPDQEDPPLPSHVLFESRLVLAVSAGGRFAGLDPVPADAVAREPWIATPSSADEPQLGVWPGLAGRPRVRHWARDWTTKLRLVAEGAGITTVPTGMFPTAPGGVEFTRIDGVPEETRQVLLAHHPDTPDRNVQDVLRAFREATIQISASSVSAEPFQLA
jgi:DNA-binding transcriptional LysR family regulator